LKDDKGCPEDIRLQEADFETVTSLSGAEKRAKAWLRPAGKMYKGSQHTLMMRGVEHLPTNFSLATFDVAIISAGYGLISERKMIAPYDATFKGKGNPWIRERREGLKIPANTRKLLSDYQVVFFLLGKEYLTSLNLPLDPSPGQKFIYFGRGDSRPLSPSRDILCIPAGPAEVERYGGAPIIGIKGAMFELMAKVFSSNPGRWKDFLVDRTSSTMIKTLDQAKKTR
jgi:hypothetical protein